MSLRSLMTMRHPRPNGDYRLSAMSPAEGASFVAPCDSKSSRQRARRCARDPQEAAVCIARHRCVVVRLQLKKKTDVSWRIGPPHHVHVIILIQPKYGGALLPARDCDPPTRFHGDERSFATTSVTLLAPDEQAIPGVRQEPGGEGA